MPPDLADDFEQAHRQSVGAAAAGMQDAALGAVRLMGTAVPVLAEAAVCSATPFLRAPLLGRISAALLLHAPGSDGQCPQCAVPAPCPTERTLRT
ncbi:hypothetical protein QWM81_20310 [Streptomyces ficellus]|uniref:Uncharacterized protein n=1 Tax=Streptomyces ficellus TaxID=1977088 RepID=A0ABT7ZA42_9ACTN|nr:hypothetical protein [Streptomyces ficellus]MDN3296364.1 hypothetical protein [Streptomyces ficellus]